jgi:glycosyltransferase involved in cell wall biosynthesis
MTSITVVIPYYRQAHYLTEAIESVLAQAHDATEIIVVDDGSPDDAASIAMAYPHVRYIRQPNRGVVAARNRGLKASQGDYVVFLDGDDHLLPGHFEVSLRAFRENPEVACVFGTYRFFGSAPEENIHDCRPRPDHYATLLRNNFIGTLAGIMFKRAVLVRLGGYRDDVRGCDDYELMLRVVRQRPVRCHHQLVAEYRRHAGQMSSDLPLMLTNSIRALRLQRPYIKGHTVYQEAYRHGIRRCRLLYGDPLVWKMVSVAKAGEWRTALSYLSVLVQRHPQGLAEMLQHKLQVLAGAQSR